MTDQTKRLVEVLAQKEQTEGFLANLDRLREEGSLTKDQYAATAAEYRRRLGAADARIGEIRDELNRLLEAKQREIESCQRELARAEVRYKVGELPLEKYQVSAQNLRTELQQLEANGDRLRRLIEARSPADIGDLAASAEVRAPEAPSVPGGVGPPKGISLADRVTTLARKARLPRGRRPLRIGGVVLLVAIIALAGVALLLERKEEAASPPSTGAPEEAALPPQTPGPSDVNIPIDIEGAANVGSLHLALTYDAGLLEAVTVEPGAAAADAMLEYNINTPGQVVMGIVSSQGISGDGALAVVTFHVEEGSSTTSILILETIAAHDAATMEQIGTVTAAGSFNAEDASLAAPLLSFA